MINRVVLSGRLTKDIALKTTITGSSVCNFTLAVDRNIKHPGRQNADFINCVAWGKNAENMSKYLHQGSLIAVDGRLQSRSYEKNGHKVHVTEMLVESVNFLERKGSGEDMHPDDPYGYDPGY